MAVICKQDHISVTLSATLLSLDIKHGSWDGASGRDSKSVFGALHFVMPFYFCPHTLFSLSLSWSNKTRDSDLSQKSSHHLITTLSTVLNQVFFWQHIFAFSQLGQCGLVPGVRGLTKDLHFMTLYSLLHVRDGACCHRHMSLAKLLVLSVKQS